MEKPVISTNELLTLKFFTALGKDDDEESLYLFNSTYFDPSTGMQSSRTKQFVNSGEWYAKDKLQIQFITGSH